MSVPSVFRGAVVLGLACAVIGCQTEPDKAKSSQAGPSDKEEDKIVLDGNNITISYQFDLENNKERYLLKNTVGDLVNIKARVVGVRQMTGTVYSKEYIWGNWGLNESKELDAAEFTFDDNRHLEPRTPTVGWLGVHAGRDGLLTSMAIAGTAKMNNERVSIKVSYGEWPALDEFKMKGEVHGDSVSVAITHQYDFQLIDVDATCYFVLDSGECRYTRKQLKEWKKGEIVRFPGQGYKEVQLFGFAKTKKTEQVSGIPVEKIERVRLLTDWTFHKNGE